MRVGELIKALGGSTALARTLGLGVTQVSNWGGRNAIPRAHHLVVWRLAIEREIEWTPPDAQGLALVPAVTSESTASPSKPQRAA